MIFYALISAGPEGVVVNSSRGLADVNKNWRNCFKRLKV